MTNEQIENALCDEWNSWCDAQDLGCVSADEIMYDEDLSDEQRRYIHSFIMRWESMLTEAE